MKKRTRSWTTRVVKAERALDVVFFFQAEDGIRDKLVTGVQTCALPISGKSLRPRRTGNAPNDAIRRPSSGRLNNSALAGAHTICTPRVAITEYEISTGSSRSEERRVGKECRSRWSPNH